MAERQARTVELNGAFVRREAADAVRTFFKPVVATYNLVLEASKPGHRSTVLTAPENEPRI